MSVTFRTLDTAEKIEIKKDEVAAVAVASPIAAAAAPAVAAAPFAVAPIATALIEENLAEIKAIVPNFSENIADITIVENVMNTKIDIVKLKRQITEEIKSEIRLALENYRKSVDTDGDGVISVKEATVEAQRVCKWSCTLV